MEEKQMTVITKGNYKNIKLNEKLKVKVGDKMLDTTEYLLNDGYIIVEKLFEKSLKKTGTFGDYWIARVKYLGEDTSFFINRQADADAYDNLGTVGNKVKIIGKGEVTQAGKPYLKLSFELV